MQKASQQTVAAADTSRASEQLLSKPRITDLIPVQCCTSHATCMAQVWRSSQEAERKRLAEARLLARMRPAVSETTLLHVIQRELGRGDA